jgi:hypothetical protein
MRSELRRTSRQKVLATGWISAVEGSNHWFFPGDGSWVPTNDHVECGQKQLNELFQCWKCRQGVFPTGSLVDYYRIETKEGRKRDR